MKKKFIIDTTEIYTRENFLIKFLDQLPSIGPADGAVNYWANYFKVKNTKEVREYLKTLGAWSDEELANNTDNLKRLIWCIGMSIKQDGEWCGC